LKFKHNDMSDLERVLASCDKEWGKMIIVDGVFSMEGDIANLPEIIRLAKKYDARVMVDDAHAIGVLGENGRGTGEHFGMEDEVDLVMGTFSKSFASIGGFIAGPEDVIHYIKHISRTLIFSASMPPSAVATCLAALDIIETEPERRERLWDIAHRMQREYKNMGFDIGPTQTPIIPIYIGDDMKCFQFWKMLFDEGIFTNPIISPAVSPGFQLLRTSYTATHTDRQMDRVLEVFEKVGGFRESLGFARRGTSYIQAEEPELALRMKRTMGKGVVYNPHAIVYHRITKSKLEVSSLLWRSFYQGYSKALLGRQNISSDAMATERAYLKSLLLKFIPLRIKRLYRLEEMRKLSVLIASILSVCLGFVYGYVVERVMVRERPLESREG